MLVSGIAIIVLVVSGVVVLFVIMQENANVADSAVDVVDHSTKRGQEAVDFTWDGTDVSLHNKGPDIKILEYRVLDDDGTVLRICDVEQEIGASKQGHRSRYVCV